MRALLLENIHPSPTEGFARAGIDVETRPGSLSEGELVATLPGVELLGIRSNTFLTDRALAAFPQEVPRSPGCGESALEATVFT